MGTLIWRISVGIGILVFISGCSVSPSVLLAESIEFPTPIAIYPPPPKNTWTAIVDLIVPEVELAANQAEKLTIRYGGRVVYSSAWYEYHQHILKMEILIPVEQFNNLHQSLLGLGQVVADKISSISEPSGRIIPSDTARITLKLRSEPSEIQPVFSNSRQSWNPLATFKRASTVFMKIFGFLVDMLIWMAVVAGPFILVALFIWWLVMRIRRLQPIKPVKKDE